VGTVNGLDEVGGLSALLLPLLGDLLKREGHEGCVKVLEGGVLGYLQQHIAQLGRACRRDVADGGIGVQPAAHSEKMGPTSKMRKSRAAYHCQHGLTPMQASQE
jgi:hypothetical protein